MRRPAIFLAAVAAPLPAALAQVTNPVTKGTLSIGLQPFTTINTTTFGTPQDLVTANDNTGRTFIATRNGSILIANPNGSLNPAPFLNVAAAPGVSLFTGGEGGLLSVAFSPTFAAPSSVPGSGKFYTFQTETFNAANTAHFSHPELVQTNAENTPDNHIVIREWTVSSDANAANTSSRVLMRIDHPQSNHQGGGLVFGQDNNLYIALGDGGGGNDNSGGRTNVNDGHTNNLGNAQDRTNVFGKILRINPLGTDSANGQYGIPASNPYDAASGFVREIYAYGLRNPYRISVDSANGNIYAADVGQGSREEVNIITSGGNYGWVFREGTLDNSGSYGVAPPPGFSPTARIAEYTHADGIAVIGGFVARNPNLYGPDLTGKYVFGELNGPGAGVGGRIFYTDATGGTVFEFNYDTAPGTVLPPNSSLHAFGQDQNQTLYALFANGQVLRIVPEPTVIMPVAAGLWLLTARRRKA